MPEFRRAMKRNARMLDGIGMFSDDIRDMVRGHVFYEYGIPCGDGHSHIVIHYCPWCAKPLLPASLRERWVDELIAMGYADPLFDETIPEAYKTDRWWREHI